MTFQSKYKLDNDNWKSLEGEFKSFKQYNNKCHDLCNYIEKTTPREVSDSSSKKKTFRKKKINFMAVGKIPFATLGNTAAYCFFPTPLSKIVWNATHLLPSGWTKVHPSGSNREVHSALGMNWSSSLGRNLPFHTYLRCG